jgi:lipoyl synthase
VLFPVIRVSAGTAACLGLKEIRAQVKPTTAYLLLGESCLMGCSFCPQSQSSGNGSGSDRLGRVNWPLFPLPEMADSLRAGGGAGFQRVCLQGVRAPEGPGPLLKALRTLKEATALPICISAWVNGLEEAGTFLEAGAERVSIALDAATPAVYRRVKGGSFRERLTLLLACARRFPGRIGTHLILGLGETEEEALGLMDGLYREGVTVALFAFTPLKGTPLARETPPDPASYRRLQAASYLLEQKALDFSRLGFQAGRLTSLGLTAAELQEGLKGGRAFETRGCPGCNRPFYNEKPGGFLYNYPRPLTGEEERAAVALLPASEQEGEHLGTGNLAPGA